jgi:hypothetical protein
MGLGQPRSAEESQNIWRLGRISTLGGADSSLQLRRLFLNRLSSSYYSPKFEDSKRIRLFYCDAPVN